MIISYIVDTIKATKDWDLSTRGLMTFWDRHVIKRNTFNAWEIKVQFTAHKNFRQKLQLQGNNFFSQIKDLIDLYSISIWNKR